MVARWVASRAGPTRTHTGLGRRDSQVETWLCRSCPSAPASTSDHPQHRRAPRWCRAEHVAPRSGVVHRRGAHRRGHQRLQPATRNHVTCRHSSALRIGPPPRRTRRSAGAETATAFKNVVALAVGLAEGLSDRFDENALIASFGNARAAVFARDAAAPRRRCRHGVAARRHRPGQPPLRHQGRPGPRRDAHRAAGLTDPSRRSPNRRGSQLDVATRAKWSVNHLPARRARRRRVRRVLRTGG